MERLSYGTRYVFKKATKDNQPVQSELVPVIQWRKANAIHAYMESSLNVSIENCVDYEVTKEQLSQLLETIDKVLDNKKLAPSLLPTTQGFFFGSQVYETYYFEDLHQTKSALTIELKEFDENTEQFFYHAWW